MNILWDIRGFYFIFNFFTPKGRLKISLFLIDSLSENDLFSEITLMLLEFSPTIETIKNIIK